MTEAIKGRVVYYKKTPNTYKISGVSEKCIYRITYSKIFEKKIKLSLVGYQYYSWSEAESDSPNSPNLTFDDSSKTIVTLYGPNPPPKSGT